MGIVKSGPSGGKQPLRGKVRCWECGEYDPVLVVLPTSGNSVCRECAGPMFADVVEVKRAKAPRS